MVKVARQGRASRRGHAPCRRPSARATIDATLDSFVFELTGETDEIDQFIAMMAVVGLVEVSRTGIAAMSRGAEGM